MTIKRKFGGMLARLLRNGVTLTAAEYAVLCSLVDALPAELRSTVKSQLEAYNLVQREADGRALNFFRFKNGSISFVDDLPQIDMRADGDDLVRARLCISGDPEPYYVALSAVQGRLFTLSFSRAPGVHAGRTVQVLDIEQAWRATVILASGDTEEMPSIPVRGDPEKTGAPPAARLDSNPGQLDSRAAQGNSTKTERRIYLAAIWLASASALMQLALFSWIIAARLLETPIPISGLGRNVTLFYLAGVMSLFEGLHIPLFPLLSLPVGSLIAGMAVAVLIVRRILIWRRFGSASPPASYHRTAANLLGICMASLAIAALGLLAAPLLSANYQIAFVFKLFGALLLPGILSLPAKYLLGAILLYVEIASIRHEGWWPRPGMAPYAASTSRFSGSFSKRLTLNILASRKIRHTIASAAVLVLIIAPVWSVFPTGVIHKRLCSTAAGEHVYEKVRARSFLFRGEGVSEDGLHLHQAIEDVGNRQVDFIEVLKDPGNNHQANVFGFMFGTHDPKGKIFRISVGPAQGANCLRGLEYHRIGQTLPPGECLQYAAVESASSRYHVEAVDGQQARWFTPSLRSDGARVIDSRTNNLLGEDLNYTNTSLIAFFVLGEERMICLPRYGRQPARLYRKVLLGLD